MISSLKSRFDLFGRRALYVTAGRARVYHWNNGKLDGIYTFDTSDQGLALFEEYLHENSEDPIYILTDLADEEFRLDAVPHVTGSDRRSLLERRKAKLFRSAKYTYCEIQGREKEGRKDDRVLFAALTEDEALQPWLSRLESSKVPVAGIFSVALLSKEMLKVLGHGGGPALIVSLQRNAGLRETFFQNSDFKFSRLVRVPRYGTESYAPLISDETEKMLRYLRSMRQITQDTLVKVYLVADDKLLSELDEASISKSGVSYNRISLEDLAARIGYKADFIDPFAESVFVYLLLKNKNRNIYAKDYETRYYKLRQFRHLLLSSSLFILLASFIWSGLAFIEGVTLKQEALNAKVKTEFYTERYEMAQEQLPEMPVEPDDLKTAVDIAEAMEKYKTSPLPIMKTLSQGLEAFPNVQLNKIDWLVSKDPNASPKSAVADQENADTISPSEQFIYYHIAEITGSLVPFEGNFRQAIAVVNHLAENIRAQANVYNVKILTLPLDVSSEAKLQGTAETVEGKADFSLRIVQGVSDEE